MNKEKGSLLIASLWMLALFSILIANVGFQGSQHALLMKRELQGFDRKAHFYNALYRAGQSFLEDPEPHEDSLADFNVILRPEGPKDLRDSSPPPAAQNDGVEITDEESRLNLNFAERAWLEAFLKLFEEKTPLKGERKDFIKTLLKKRSKGRILSLEELYLLEGIEKEDVEKLRPFLTVYPELSQVNINTVDPLVLESLIESLSGDSFAKKELLRKILAPSPLTLSPRVGEGRVRGENRYVFRMEDLQPPLFIQKLGLTPNIQMVSLIQRLIPFLTTDSRTYRIRMKTDTGEAEAVFREKISEPGLEVLSLHEE